MVLGFVVRPRRDTDRRGDLHVWFRAVVVRDWCACGGFAGLIGIDSLVIQFMIFAIVSVSLTAASRTIFLNYFTRERAGESLRSGVDSLPGKVGTVVSSSKGALQEGAVKVFGSTWTAYPAPGEQPLEAGERVCVESVEGASIYVRRIGDEPDWRPKNFRI